jgi:hypothetical protein
MSNQGDPNMVEALNGDIGPMGSEVVEADKTV